MSRAELMAKMTPHGIVISGQGFGGTPAISAMDVAGALGMGKLARPAYLFGLMLRMGYQATWCAGSQEACAVIEDYMAQVGGE